MGRIRFGTFRAFGVRNFRLFFIGQVLSVSGTWAQRVGQAWLAYRLTHSSLYLGLITFAASAPAFVFTPIAGVVADRVDRRTLLVLAQILAMLQAVALAAATLSGSITASWLLLLSLLQGVINAFENPVRQSYYSEMVGPGHLSNAIALNASLVNLARVVGPAIAGVLVARWGEGVCFAANAASFLAVIVALLMMKITRREREIGTRGGWRLVREGFSFIRGAPAVRAMLTNFGIFNLAGSPYLTLLPILAVERLGIGSVGLGWLVSASGIGAIASSLLLASRSETRGLPAASFVATSVAGAALIVLGISRSFTLSLLMLVLVGAGYSFSLASTQTVMQTWVHEVMRGRVMSFYSLIFLGVPPIGSLIAGVAAEKFHATATVAGGGLLCVLGTLYCRRQESVRRAEAGDAL